MDLIEQKPHGIPTIPVGPGECTQPLNFAPRDAGVYTATLAVPAAAVRPYPRVGTVSNPDF
jgi:hypothetical protein